MHKLWVMLLASALIACSWVHPTGSLAQNAGAATAPEGAPAVTVKGKVLDRIDAAPYSYLKLSTASGETWAAVPQTTVSVGSEVTVAGAFPMKNFESKTLKRKFDVVYFGTLDNGGSAAPLAVHGGPGSLPPGHPGAPGNGGAMAAQHRVAAAGPADVKTMKVAKASGPDGRTVAEVHAHRAALAEKTVTIHAQVVKFNAGIMGRNWVHLRDGSGSQDKGDNDITVTTQDTVAVGDVVTVKGTVRVDKDFGAGYAYPVIIEEAQVSK
jgi:hypothetical protein